MCSLTQLGLAEVSSLENLSFIDFPAGVTVVAKGNTNLPTSSIWKKKSPISRNKMEGNKPAVEKEWNPDEVELKLNKNEIKLRL